MNTKHPDAIRSVCRLLCLLSILAFFILGTNDALAAGAVTPFTVVEAENGALGGGAAIRIFTPGSPVPSAATLELEASGMALVELNATGEFVSVTNPVVNANAIVIRNSIPDASNGGGITNTINLYVDGVFRQAVTLSSRQSWVYRNATTNPDDPNAEGVPYRFYNEDRTFITGAAIAAGSIITLQKDAANTAAIYDIDCVDLENVPAAKTQPTNSISITSGPYNADPTFTTDSTAAIKSCINAARAQGKSVWIPEGKFMLNHLASGGLDITGVTVNGAGVWYSTLYRNIPLPPATTPWRSNIHLGTNSTMRDVFVDSDAIYRDIGGDGGDDYGLTSSGTNWLVERVWVQHCDAQWMSGSFGTFRDSRIYGSWADGINLNNGNSPNNSQLGISLTASNNFVRGSGDDNIATYSDSGASGSNPEMQNTTIVNNTTVAAYWANGLRIAGGTNVTVQGNLIESAPSDSGMEVSIFGATGHPLDSALVADNVIMRGGGWNGTDRHGMHVGSTTTTRATITNNIIRDALRAGLNIDTHDEALIVSRNVIDHPAKQGVLIDSGVSGTGFLEYNLVTNLNAGQTAFVNNAPGTFFTTEISNSWNVPDPTLLIKADTTTMNTAGDWGGTAPSAGYSGQFDNTINAMSEAVLTLGGNVTMNRLSFLANLNGPVVVGSGNTLTLTNATAINLGTANFDVTMNCALVATGFGVGSGRTLTLGGGSTAFLSGTSTGMGTLQLNAASAKSFTANGNPIINMGNPTTGTGGLVVSNNCTLTESGSFQIGINGSSGLVTINSPTAAFNTLGSAGTIMVARNGGASNGRLTLVNGSISTAGSSNPTGIQIGLSLNNAAARGWLDIQGGSLTVPQTLSIGKTITTAAAQTAMTIEGGTSTIGTINFGDSSTTGSGSLTMTGGALYVGAGGMNHLGTGSFTSGGTIGATADWSSSLPMTLANVNGSITFQTADSNAVAHNITLSGVLSGAGGLIKTGSGTLILSGANTYTGGTILTAGTLALTEPGSISNSTVINIGGGATLDITGRTDDALTLRNGQTLTGAGSINGKLTTLAGSTLAPGAFTGTLTVTNDIVLGGSLLVELNRTNVQTSDKLNSILGAITGGGTLTVSNTGPNLQAGDTFQLFSAPVSGFANITLPTTNSLGSIYNWTNRLSSDGSIQIVNVAPASSSPGKIQFNASGNTLTLAWPANAGWLLQMQTNSLTDSNWITLPGSDLLTSTNIPIDPANNGIFFRLIYP
jgi:autotransporter-associated beta strand protein